MSIIAGVDIGNSTTEVCIGREEGGHISFLASASHMTTGTKGTIDNVPGVISALTEATGNAGISIQDISMLRLNEAAPVIGDTAMETITETIITDSSMIGHNPSTPAGAGTAVGRTISFHHLMELEKSGGLAAKDQSLIRASVIDSNVTDFQKNRNDMNFDKKYIVTIGKENDYEQIAEFINGSRNQENVAGLILQADEAVLVWNRLQKKIPIIDEVARIDKIPDGKLAAIEVALSGQVIHQLSNPYGIATLLHLDAEETRLVTPIAKSLIGKKSAVVIKTLHESIGEHVLPAGDLYLIPEENKSFQQRSLAEKEQEYSISVDAGARKIMELIHSIGKIKDVKGQACTNVGNMFDRMKYNMSKLTKESTDSIHITDILAVDTLAPVLISGALAGETCMERAVGIAAMVRTKQLPMQTIADQLTHLLPAKVKVAGIEAAMALLGAFTTPGTKLPLAMVDMGGGSTDAAMLTEAGEMRFVHKAGAGELVTLLIKTELGLPEREVAEMIKKYPLAKVESLYHLRLESGEMQFFEEAIDPRYYGCVVLLLPRRMVRLETNHPMERIAQVRRDAKKKVLVNNVLRALTEIAPEGNLKKIPNVVLVGGSAEDFEVPGMLTEVFMKYRIVCGRGNIRAELGARNAVATGLVLSSISDGGRRT